MRRQAGGQVVGVVGGPQARSNNWVQAGCQGQASGRCRVSRRAEVAIRAGTVISRRRMVPVVALASAVWVSVAAARVKLNAITASTSQAPLAVNRPLGRWARAECFRSAWTCSMMAWPRWVLSALTVSRLLVVMSRTLVVAALAWVVRCQGGERATAIM